jgi:hypothetical protein
LAWSAYAAEPRRVEVSRDTWISSFHSEQEGNNGGASKLKLEGTQEFFLIDFDPAKFKGRRVVRATLNVKLEAAFPLGRTTVSTITQEWVEGKGSGYAKEPGATSFRWARNGEQRWNGDGKDITAVSLGLGGSTWVSATRRRPMPTAGRPSPSTPPSSRPALTDAASASS